MGTILTNFTLVGLTNLSFQCRATPAASVDNKVTEDDPGLKDDGVDETTGVDSDFFHRQYDSPIKQNQCSTSKNKRLKLSNWINA